MGRVKRLLPGIIGFIGLAILIHSTGYIPRSPTLFTLGSFIGITLIYIAIRRFIKILEGDGG